MKVVHLSTSSRGGAGIAALRLHKSLIAAGVNSVFISRDKGNVTGCYSLEELYPSDARSRSRMNIYASKLGLKKITNAYLSKKYLKGRSAGLEYFSFPYSNHYPEMMGAVREADIVHLHWIADDFINTPTFFPALAHKKIVWTLHDMNPFTGGCHHSDGHNGFRGNCMNCPQLPEPQNAHLAAEMLLKKTESYSSVHNLQIVTPSAWLMGLSRKSTAFHKLRHTVIPNYIDDSVFTLQPKEEARAKLNIPADKKVALFVSHTLANPRKGIDALYRSFDSLENDQYILCSAGAPDPSRKNMLQTGYLSDDHDMALAYNAADVFVLPSIAENYPNTISEALLCGCPVIACNTGGIPEQLDPANGILISPGNETELASALQSVFNDPERFNRQAIRQGAQQKLSFSNTTGQYISLYKNVLS